mmetsp:Transcript_8783/g.16710  ORF Transcript_8783/g.16710 Transcript_8783/m.16710 type:complete len:165 (+) Transcript_8783:746-1240(+)
MCPVTGDIPKPNTGSSAGSDSEASLAWRQLHGTKPGTCTPRCRTSTCQFPFSTLHHGSALLAFSIHGYRKYKLNCHNALHGAARHFAVLFSADPPVTVACGRIFPLPFAAGPSPMGLPVPTAAWEAAELSFAAIAVAETGDASFRLSLGVANRQVCSIIQHHGG